MSNKTKDKNEKLTHFGYQAKESVESLLKPPAGKTGEVTPKTNLQTTNHNEKDKQ